MISNKFSGDFSENNISHKISDLKEKGIELLNLIESNPTVCGFDYNSELILDSFRSANNLKYNPSYDGILLTKEKIAELHRKDLAMNDITLTAGTSESYSYLLKMLANPGDNILIPKPSYPLLDILCGLESLEVKYYSTTFDGKEWVTDFDSIHSQINDKTKAIIIINPNNPTGNYFSKEESDSLIKFCSDRKISLIIDEVFNDYSLTGKKFSFVEANVYDNSSLFVLNGISKMLALPQMKLGWIINLSGKKIKSGFNNILEMISDTYLTVNTPVQNAFPVLLKTLDDIQSQILNRIGKNYKFLNNYQLIILIKLMSLKNNCHKNKKKTLQVR